MPKGKKLTKVDCMHKNSPFGVFQLNCDRIIRGKMRIWSRM